MPIQGLLSLRYKNNPHEGELLFWWLLPDLNWGHKALQASALPTELKSHTIGLLDHLFYAADQRPGLCSATICVSRRR